MSYHQFYEFRALDRPLTSAQLAEVRGISTRASVTTTRFSVSYDWGDLKASSDSLLDKYFDAHFYSSSNFKRLTFKLPNGVLPLAVLKSFLGDDRFSADERKSGLHLSWGFEDEGAGWIEDENEASEFEYLLPIRATLASGDLRPLYVAWLAGIAQYEDERPEPPLPPGLGAEDDSSRALAEWLGVSADLLAAAAEASAAPPAKVRERDALAWLATFPVADRDRALVAFLGVGDGEPRLALQRLWTGWLASRNLEKQKAISRSVGDLLARSRALANERREREVREKAAKRVAHLDSVGKTANAIWKQIAILAESRVQSAPKQIVAQLRDLRDAADRDGTRAAFDDRLAAFAAPLSPTRVLAKTLREAGLVR